MKLQNKIAVISGASKGLGRALAIRFIKEGAFVCVCARNTDLLRSLQLEILSSGGKFHCEQADVSDENQSREFIHNCYNTYGNIHILVNNASVLGARVPIADYPSMEWHKTLSVNLNGVFYLTKHAIPLFDSSGGSIINVSSSVGKINKENWGAYGVSKFAVEGLTQGLAEELKSKHIRVNAVNPGPMKTEMRQKAYMHGDKVIAKNPADVLDVFVYLSSDFSKHVTGKSIDAQQFKGTL